METKTVLITGANKGIGFETARQLAEAGYYVFIGSRNENNGKQAVAELKAAGLHHAESVVLDVRDETSLQEAHNIIAQRTPQLDVLINNAGIRGAIPQIPSKISDEEIKNVFETNFFGTVRTIRIFMDLLQNAPQPRIVNVTSDLGSLTLHNDPNWEYYKFKAAAYGPSKTALNAYTVALAYELRDTAFKVNAVNPGYTSTDFNDHTGTKEVTEAAKVIVAHAMLGADGPTGQYVSDYGITPW